MSYAINVYFNDGDIESTRIYNSDSLLYTGYYNPDNHYSNDKIEGNVTFLAIAETGYSFTRWVYRLGSTSSTVQYSYSNPFTYEGDQNIYIRAEGGIDESETDAIWSLSKEEIGILSEECSKILAFDSYNKMFRYSVSFSNSGTATFYTTGSIDTYGYLGTTMGFNDEAGIPAKCVEENDDGGSGNNFKIQYEVTSGTTYYVWIKTYDGSAVGLSKLHIEPPAATTSSWTLSTYSAGTITKKCYEHIYIETYMLYRCKVQFANAGTATFYTEGDVDTYGYLSDSDEWDSENGKPSSYLKRNDDGGSGNNFSFTYDVEANTTYYLWVKSYNGEYSGHVYLYIDPSSAEVERPEDFSWTYPKTRGESFNLTAAEWNSLADRINDFRKYKGLSDYSFTTAYIKDVFTAAMYNQSRKAIQGVDGYGTYIPTVYTGEDVTAHAMNALVSELNAIP